MSDIMVGQVSSDLCVGLGLVRPTPNDIGFRVVYGLLHRVPGDMGFG